MNNRFQITLPKLGESIVSATIVQWLKKEGDLIRLDEPLVEVATDKVNSEIPSPVAGVLKEILAKVDQEIAVGDPLAWIEMTSEEKSVEDAVSTASDQIGSKSCGNIKPIENLKNCFLSPAVLTMARHENLSVDTVQKIQGSGEQGRVTKKDLEKYIQNRNSASSEITPPSFTALPSSSSEGSSCRFMKKDFVESIATVTPRGNVEPLKMSGMRKAIADNMVRSFYEAPHASLVTEIDVTDVMTLIQKEKECFLAVHGVKLTITSYLIQALTHAVHQFPMLNSSLEKDTILMKRYVNVGIAVNVEKGLIVPVIKNCQDRNIVSIAKAVSDLSTRARNNKLSADDISEGSITLTNFGMTGALIGVPIIRYPEVAILGAGTVQKRVVVKEDDSFSIRSMMYVTLTFDHRVIDGIYGCEFLSAFKNTLERSHSG